MDRNERFAFFQQMLLDCYGLWSWTLDRDLTVLETTCPQRKLHTSLLLSPGRSEALKKFLRESRMPMILSSPIGLLWAAVCIPGEGTDTPPSGIQIIGPIFSKTVSGAMIEQLLSPLNLSFRRKYEMIENMKLVPVIPTVNFFQQVIMLNYCVCGSVVRISDLVYYTADTPADDREVSAEFAERMGAPHSPLINEKMLLDMVRTGNLDYHEALSNAGAASPGIRAKSSDPIRQAQYSVVSFITLCTRAAMEGGLASDCAYTLCDTYTESVDSCKTISEIAAVSHTMYDDFIRRVNRCRNASGVSRPVQACCDYLDTHPMAEFSVEELAEKAGYTTYYFTRVFKKETGKTIKAYIRDVRIRQAKTLLSTTNLSIQEISEQLHFCSQSYFAGQFQRAEGMTPADYRSQNQNQ